MCVTEAVWVPADTKTTFMLQFLHTEMGVFIFSIPSVRLFGQFRLSW